MRRLLPLGLLAIATLQPCLAQSPARTPSSPQTHLLAFDVASVREDKSGGLPTSNIPLDRGNAYAPTGGIFVATNQSLVTLLIFAYKIKISEFRGGLIRSLPHWAVADKFDINARSASTNPTRDDLRSMVQTLLQDRFNLVVHREVRPSPLFGLYLAKPGKTGLQLRPHPSTASCANALPTPADVTPIESLIGTWPPHCGDGTETRISKYRLREGGRDMTMPAIADWLSGAGDLERPIVDRTGLAGTYDFVFEFDPESTQREAISSAPHDDSGPTFTEAIREQLGLELKKEQGANSIFVVDRIEYPSEN